MFFRKSANATYRGSLDAKQLEISCSRQTDDGAGQDAGRVQKYTI